MHAENAGASGDFAVLLATVVVLALATCLTWLIEKPAMEWLRKTYRRQSIPLISIRRSAALAGVLMIGIAGLSFAWHRTHPSLPQPGDLVGQVFRPSSLARIPCRLGTESRPLIVLVLGQSNAGNHGEAGSIPVSAVNAATFYFDGECYWTTGPAPGATGRGGNVWSFLAPELARAIGRPVIFSVLAVEGTQIRDWVEPGKLRERLEYTIAMHKRDGFVPDVVLWAQGEADAKGGTTRAKYAERFRELVTTLRGSGIHAPIVAALSTRCRNEGSEAVRSAIGLVAATDSSITIGPDLDLLSVDYRYDGCHFSVPGLAAVAERWASAISKIR